jgi:hypothetical protein
MAKFYLPAPSRSNPVAEKVADYNYADFAQYRPLDHLLRHVDPSPVNAALATWRCMNWSAPDKPADIPGQADEALYWAKGDGRNRTCPIPGCAPRDT